MSRLVVGVFVEGWQQGCCGDSVEIGDRVTWRLVLRPEAWWPGVETPVAVQPVPDDALAEWTALGNDAGPAPVLASSGGLTVFVPDGSTVASGVLRGGLKEDRHVGAPTGVPPTTGRVERLRLVTRAYELRARRELIPVAGSEVLTEVREMGRTLPDDPPSSGPLERLVDGFVVDLAVDARRDRG